MVQACEDGEAGVPGEGAVDRRHGTPSPLLRVVPEGPAWPPASALSGEVAPPAEGQDSVCLQHAHTVGLPEAAADPSPGWVGWMQGLSWARWAVLSGQFQLWEEGSQSEDKQYTRGRFPLVRMENIQC